MPHSTITKGKKPTVNDIARVAEVSLATVDRVLNNRPGVREQTIKRVNEAIVELGFVRDAAAVNLARRRYFQLLFVLPETQNEFVVELLDEISEQQTKLLHQRVNLDVNLVRPFDPEAIVAVLDGLDPETVDGVAIFGPETPSVRDCIGRTRARGISVVALVSDIPSSDRDRFVGIDNVAAGRTAAQLMGRFIRGTGQILVITGSRLARDHIDRRSGFDAVMSSSFPDLEILASLEGKDDPEVIAELLPTVFTSFPEIKGIYSSAAGNPGLIEFLEKTGRHDIVVIAHELTPSSRLALASGTFDAVISQDTGHLVRSATRVLTAAANQSQLDDTQERIRIDIYLKDNMPNSNDQRGRSQ